MKQRLLIVCAVGAAGVLAAVLVARRDAGSSIYQGKPIKAWARQAYAGDQQAAAAIKAMGPRAVPELIRLLRTKDSFVRLQLWFLRPKLPLRLRYWIDRKVGPPDAAAVRGAAARSLGIIGPDAESAVPVLARALRDPAHQVCYDAAAALACIGKAAVPVLIEALRMKDPNRRRSVIFALAQIGPEAEVAVPVLTQTLNDPDQSVRDAAAFSVTAIVSPLIPPLVKRARDPAPAKRREALERLGAIHAGGSPSVITNLLVRALKDPVAEVRLAAVKALGQVSENAQPAVAALTECLKDESAAVREWSARTLGEIGAPARPAIAELTRLAEDKVASVRAAAKEALRKIESGG